MQNQLIDLNNHLFAQMERLSDEGLKGEALETELERSKAITSISKQIVSNANLALKAKIAAKEYGLGKGLPEMIEKDGLPKIDQKS